MKIKRKKIEQLRKKIETIREDQIGRILDIDSILEQLKDECIVEGIEFIYTNDVIIPIIIPIDDEYDNYDLYYEIRVQTENDIVSNLYYYCV
ncbi:MAG: hypothetical protein LCH34_14295 [Firmicutes bacterium]|nr:hypothetical protein [Bacillota bacterium]